MSRKKCGGMFRGAPLCMVMECHTYSDTIFSFLHSQSHNVGRGRMNTQRTRRRIPSKFDVILAFVQN